MLFRSLKKPDQFVDDPITDVLRAGARKLLIEALEVEIEVFCPSTGISETVSTAKEWSAMVIFLSVKSKPELVR